MKKKTETVGVPLTDAVAQRWLHGHIDERDGDGDGDSERGWVIRLGLDSGVLRLQDGGFC